MSDPVIYLVAQDNGDKYLVEASSRAQAIRHVARNMFDAKPATPRDVARLMGDGLTVESAKQQEADEAETRG